MKNLILTILALMAFSLAAQAQYPYVRPYPAPYPYPYPAPYPRPYYPAPVVPVYPMQPAYIYTCNAYGIMNGLVFYGLGTDIFTASQRAMIACQMSGQACQPTGCR